ncbi:hypothetical protein F5878DRAFT_233908 [Lentinula raphanica]|uniref:Uncharacterized protein n=1 Tax=Lentinula raphanica TaxID=153919 RepID=A0AA38UJM9_9AGAR|nr:hypothetical protein F5878DRAFT_233908 [Lentinula raphanica]
MILPPYHHFLAFLLTLGVAAIAVAAPFPHATTHGESSEDNSGTLVYERATSAECDPSTLPGTLPNTPSDGLWAENVSLNLLHCNPAVDGGCPPGQSPPVPRLVIEGCADAAQRQKVMDPTKAASFPHPLSLLAVSLQTINGHTILAEMSVRGLKLSP